MAYFVEIKNGLVVNSIVINDAEIGTELQTSDSIRNQFAQLGYTYDETSDQFVAPQPFLSWVLDTNNIWQAPSAIPNDGKMYRWDESSLAWVVLVG